MHWNQDAIDNEAGGVVTPDWMLADPLRERERSVDRLVSRELGSNDFDQRHERCRVEEMHSDDTLRARR